MLIPAILFRDVIVEKFYKDMYTDRMFCYTFATNPGEITICDNIVGMYEYAIVKQEGDNDEVVGYFSYRVNSDTDSIDNISLYSFDEGNSLIGIDVGIKFKELVEKYRRISWSMIEGNPVERHYDKLLEKYHGVKTRSRKVIKDPDLNYRDILNYEILKEDNIKREVRHEKVL